MNEDGPSLHALMRRASGTRSVFLLLLFVPGLLCLRCYLYHEIWEDGRKLQISPDICSSNRYCVSVIYRDPNPVKKNGYSMGCDRVDCDESDGVDAAEWRSLTDGMRCRKHHDYGRQGEICCCKQELCNGGSSPIAFLSSAVVALIIVFPPFFLL